MAGKLILWVLAAFLALLAALLLAPVKVRFAYDQGDLSLEVQYGPAKLRLLPPGEKPPGKKKAPKAKKPQKPKKAKEKPKRPKPKINLDQILYALETMPPILGRALRRTGRSVRIGPLKVYALVAGEDPADAALLYGRLEAAVAALLPVLERALRIRDPDVRLYLDFSRREMDFIADVGASFRPAGLVWTALRTGGSLVKWSFGFRRLAPPPGASEEKPEEKPEENGKTEHAAA